MTTGEERQAVTVKIIGVGGSGGNALNTMVETAPSGMDFIAMNRDAVSLERNLAPTKVLFGNGIPASAPEAMGKAALESAGRIRELVAGAEVVLIIAGMGGGTGTGGAPVVAQMAREAGAITIGMVTSPFLFEGKLRRAQADVGLGALNQRADAVFVLSNDRLMASAPDDLPLLQLFKGIDEAMLRVACSIRDHVSATRDASVAPIRAILGDYAHAFAGAELLS